MKWFESLSIERQSPALCTCGCFCTKMTRLAQAPGCWCDDAITLDQAGKARRRFEASYKLCEVASLSNLKTRLSPGSVALTARLFFALPILREVRLNLASIVCTIRV